MKSDEKLKYIYNHIQEVKEQADIIKESLKTMYNHIKIIEKLSKSESEEDSTK